MNIHLSHIQRLRQPFRTSWILFLPVLLLLMLSAGSAQAATIGFAATDVADAVPGEDLWRYDYTVSGVAFLQSQFFDIYFDPLLYGHLTPGPAPNADWDVLILVQPDPTVLPPFDRGRFDAFALTDNPSLAGTFSVTFVYLGSGSPGSQPFDVFDANGNVLTSGFTTPIGAIPEPATFTSMLAVWGVLGIRFVRKCKARR
jgi:hypothetical protein